MFAPDFFDSDFFDVAEVQPDPDPDPEPSPEPRPVRPGRIVRHHLGPLKITRIRNRDR